MPRGTVNHRVTMASGPLKTIVLDAQQDTSHCGKPRALGPLRERARRSPLAATGLYPTLTLGQVNGRHWPWICQRTGGKLDLPGPFQHQEQAAADHVAHSAVGLFPAPLLA